MIYPGQMSGMAQQKTDWGSIFTAAVPGVSAAIPLTSQILSMFGVKTGAQEAAEERTRQAQIALRVAREQRLAQQAAIAAERTRAAEKQRRLIIYGAMGAAALVGYAVLSRPRR